MTLADGQKLKLACDHEPPADLIEQIRRDKQKIIALLTNPKVPAPQTTKPKCLVLVLEVGGRKITAIDTISATPEAAILRERERWGNYLSRIWARGGGLIWAREDFVGVTTRGRDQYFRPRVR